MNWMRAGLAALGLVTALALGDAAASADEQTVKAFASWSARGQMFETGPTRHTFVGSFSGMIYIDTEKGPIDGGFMVCPAVLDVDTTDGKQTGKGRCTITGKEDSRVYADLSCEGVHLVGCNGDFTITGGTGRFEGITGGGPITIRSGLAEISVGGGNIIQESAAGIIYWPKLTYKLPETAPASDAPASP